MAPGVAQTPTNLPACMDLPVGMRGAVVRGRGPWAVGCNVGDTLGIRKPGKPGNPSKAI